MSTTVVFASNNPGKFIEMSSLFTGSPWNLVPQSTFNVKEAEEPYMTFVENALTKARNASLATGLPSLAEDSGLCVTTLNGAPGVISARWATGVANDNANNQKLIQEMAQQPDKRLYYYCVLVFIRSATDCQPEIVSARWDGVFKEKPVGDNGFAYDPHVYIPDLTKTVAQLTVREKNLYSHRGAAARQLKSKLILDTYYKAGAWQ